MMYMIKIALLISLSLIPNIATTPITPAPRAVPPVSTDSTACIDPATPLLELARTYSWPAPNGGAEMKAFAELRRYLAAPTPRAYHEVLASYKWLDMLHTDLHSQLALGILYASGYDLNYPRAEGYRHNAISNNANADDYGARALNYVSSHDPSQWIAAIALTRIALVSPEQQRMDDAVAAVTRSLQRDSSSIPMRLAWHDLLIAQERTTEALAFDRERPATCAPMSHAMAESLLLTGDTAAGVHLYLETLAQAQPGELHRFRDDIRVFATQGDLKTYAALPPSQRAAWISNYWKFSATSFARSLEARVTEQMVRAAYADAHFRATEFAVTNDKPNWVDDTAHIVPWDSRGVVYVRHGAPLRRLKIMNSCAEAFEAWVYSGEGAPWVVWFAHSCMSMMTGAGPQDVMMRRTFDWRPIYAPPACGRPFLTRPVPTLESSLVKLQKNPEDIDRRDIYTLLSQYDPRYAELLHECAKIPMGDMTPRAAQILYTLNREGRELFGSLKWTEDALPQYAHRVAMMIGAYEFQNALHHSELAAITWINLADLPNTEVTQDRVRYSYIVTDGPMHAARVDTSVPIPIHGGEPDVMLRSLVMVPDVKTGTGLLRVFATDAADSTRGGVRSAPVEVRGYEGKHGISDIVIAMPNRAGILHRGDASMEPMPGHIVAMNHEFRVFFETYGLESGEVAETTIRLTRTDKSALQQLRSLFPGKVDARTITFANPAELDARGVMIRDVTVTGDFVPGDYRIDVSVKTKNGDVVTKHTALIITGPPGK